MALFVAEQKIPALIIAHLEARRTDPDYPMPSGTLLPLVAGPFKGTDREHPSLEVWCPGFRCERRRDDEQIEVYLDLYADKDTALATELGWLAAIRRSFAGGPIPGGANASNSSTNPFDAYLNSLDDTASAGWQVLDFHIIGGATTVLEGQRVLYRTEARATVQTYTFTV